MEFYSGNRRVAVAAGTDGKTYSVQAPVNYGAETIADGVYRFMDVVAGILPRIFYMGKIHGVKHGARKKLENENGKKKWIQQGRGTANNGKNHNGKR